MDLVRRLARRSPPSLEILGCVIGDHTDALYPVEARAVESAVASRRREFATGRWLARRALARFGVPPQPIPVGPQRAPQWPPSIVASLSHSGSICVVAMAPAQLYCGVGVDIERGQTLGDELRSSVLAPSEAAAIDSPELLRLVFCAKEAVFKCRAAARGDFADYTEVAIVVDTQLRTFAAVASSDRLRDDGLELGNGVYEADSAGTITLFAQRR